MFRETCRKFKRLKAICYIRGFFFDASIVRKAEPDVWEFMNKNIQSGWCCVDVGANRGEYSFLMANLVGPSGFIHAFELHHENARLVTYNNQRFRGRIKVENLAVSDGQKEFAQVFPGINRSVAEWNIIGSNEIDTINRAEFSVPSTSLDKYFSSYERGIDLVKIDVEGAGFEVLAGMRSILRRSRPIVVFEVHSLREWDGRKYLLEAGYTIFTMQGKIMDEAGEFIFHCIAAPNDRVLDFQSHSSPLSR